MRGLGGEDVKINRNQKSVLSLALIVFAGLLMSGPRNTFTLGALILWFVLGLWFFAVRDKRRPPMP